MKRRQNSLLNRLGLFVYVLVIFCWTIAVEAQTPQKALTRTEPLVFQVEPKVVRPVETVQPTNTSSSNSDSVEYYNSCLPYPATLQREILKIWKTDKDETRQVVVFFTLSRKGAVTALRVIKSSGSKEYDDKAMEAIRKASIPPFPQSAPPSADFQFTFLPTHLYPRPQPQKLRKF